MTELATLQIKVDASGAIRVVDQFGNSTEKAAKKANELEVSAKRVGAVMGGALVAGLALAVKETADAQREQAQLAAALRSTAGASGQTIDSLNEHAGALRQLTAATGGEIAEAQALLLTFTKIGGDTFPRATASVLDMAQALGADARGAAMQLGKALNDPILGVTALGRAGVQFSDQQKAMIAGFVETNQLAEAQKIILAELETQVGGSAAAYRNTLGGALKAARESFLELFEATGPGMQELVEDINLLADTLTTLPTRIELVKEKFKNFFLQQRGGAGAVVDRLNGRPTDADGALAQSDANIAALERLLREQQDGVIAGAVARAQARGRGGSLGSSSAAGAPVGALASTHADELAAVEAVIRQHYADSAELLRNRTDDEIAQDAAVAAVIAEHYEDSAEALGNVKTRTDALTESARVFAEQSQLALARFASDFLKDGFKSLDRFWQSFAQLGRDAIGQVFAKSVMDRIGSDVGDRLSDGLKGLFAKIGGSGAGVIGAVGLGLGLALDQVLGKSKWEEAAEESRKAARLLAEGAEDLKNSVMQSRESFLGDFLNYANTETATERELRNLDEQRRALARDAFGIAKSANGTLSNQATSLLNQGNFSNEVAALIRRDATSINQTDLGRQALLDFADALEMLNDAFVDNARAAENAANAQGILTLAQFKDSLALSGQSTLSPVQQLAEARRQYEAILALAQGGDASAVDSLPETARTLLDASRSVFASGARYADEFAKVNADITDVMARLAELAPADPLNEVPLDFDPIDIDPIADEFDDLEAVLDSLTGALGGFTNGIITSTTDMLDGFTEGVTAIDTYTDGIITSNAGTLGAFEAYTGALYDVSDEFGNVAMALQLAQGEFVNSLGGYTDGIITSTTDMLRPPAEGGGFEEVTGPWLDILAEQQASVTVQQQGFASVVAAVNRVESAIEEMRRGVVNTLEETAY